VCQRKTRAREPQYKEQICWMGYALGYRSFNHPGGPEKDTIQFA
jgi:hypothetical protein